MHHFITNTDRAAVAEEMLLQMRTLDRGSQREAFVDALANLMHLARQRGETFNDLLADARAQHDIEQAEDPEGPGLDHAEGDGQATPEIVATESKLLF